MRIALHEVSKGKGIALPVTSCALESGVATRVVMETEQRPTVLGLIASGRMRPDTGEVRLVGEAGGRREIRRRTALVDAPIVAEPEPGVSLAGVIAEELMFAGIPGDPIRVKRWAEQLHVDDHVQLPMADVPAGIRVHVLAELASLRADVEAIVLASPDRHGGDPRQWWATATTLAERGFAVLTICGMAADAVLTDHERQPAHAATHAEHADGAPLAETPAAHEAHEAHDHVDAVESAAPANESTALADETTTTAADPTASTDEAAAKPVAAPDAPPAKPGDELATAPAASPESTQHTAEERA